jgi:hypothetical protein
LPLTIVAGCIGAPGCTNEAAGFFNDHAESHLRHFVGFATSLVLGGIGKMRLEPLAPTTVLAISLIHRKSNEFDAPIEQVNFISVRQAWANSRSFVGL